PEAVDEVGGPTILATFTVIAALMPMAFVTGLMGPYMSPIPINASTGMLISLIVAFVVTPWLSYKLMSRMKFDAAETDNSSLEEQQDTKLYRFFNRLMRPLIEGAGAAKKRLMLLAGVMVLVLFAVSFPGFNLVVLKMLPYADK